MKIECVYCGPEEVYIEDEVVRPLEDAGKVSRGEWLGTEKEWRRFVDENGLTVETSDEDYAILNNKAVFVGVHYADDYGHGDHFDDDY